MFYYLYLFIQRLPFCLPVVVTLFMLPLALYLLVKGFNSIKPWIVQFGAISFAMLAIFYIAYDFFSTGKVYINNIYPPFKYEMISFILICLIIIIFSGGNIIHSLEFIAGLYLLAYLLTWILTFLIHVVVVSVLIILLAIIFLIVIFS